MNQSRQGRNGGRRGREKDRKMKRREKKTIILKTLSDELTIYPLIELVKLPPEKCINS